MRPVRADGRLSRPHSRRSPGRRGIVAVLFVLALGAAGLPLLLRSRPERATGEVPEPISPFGAASRGSITFRWTIPADEVPVRVELYDATRLPVWRSEPSRDGSLRPPGDEVQSFPAADLLWRPVALPPGSPERPGDLAAFTLSP